MSLHVAVTGLGIVSSVGVTPRDFVDALESGRVTIEEATWARTASGNPLWWAPTRFDPSRWLDARVLDGSDPFAWFALAAAQEAVTHSGLIDLHPRRTAVVVGTAVCGAYSLQRAQYEVDRDPDKADTRKAILRFLPNMPAAQMAMRWALHGPLLTVSTACASSSDAIGTAARLIASGQADVAIAGGTEGGLSPDLGRDSFHPALVHAMTSYGMLPDVTDARRASLPFDANRHGMVQGDGAGMVVLESAEHARARGAEPLAWLEGYGSLSDAYHPSSPDPSGRWERLAMSTALEEAGVAPPDVDALIAHATATPVGDTAEIRAVNELFAGRSTPLAVTSLKGHIGHTGSASGAMGLISAIEAMRRGRVAPVACTRELDAEIEFDVVLERPSPRTVKTAQVNAFGFGGQNASLVITRGPGLDRAA